MPYSTLSGPFLAPRTRMPYPRISSMLLGSALSHTTVAPPAAGRIISAAFRLERRTLWISRNM